MLVLPAGKPDKSPMMHLRLKSLVRTLTTAFVISSLALVQSGRAEIAVKSGDKIGFLGDSITAGGWGNPVGYVRLVIAGLAANGVTAEPVPAGISGHKSNQMLERLDRDVLSKKPQWMTISCGVNDVWHGKNGVPLDEEMLAKGEYALKPGEDRGTYKKNITKIVEKAQAAGAKPIILTATVIQENLASAENGKLAPFNDFLRQLAKEKQLPLADLNAMFQERIKAENKPGAKVLTSDGVHMNVAGNKLMATGVLQAMGLNAEQLKKAQESWTTLEAAAAEAAKKAAEAKAKADAAKKAATKTAPPAPDLK